MDVDVVKGRFFLPPYYIRAGTKELLTNLSVNNKLSSFWTKVRSYRNYVTISDDILEVINSKYAGKPLFNFSLNNEICTPCDLSYKGVDTDALAFLEHILIYNTNQLIVKELIPLPFKNWFISVAHSRLGSTFEEYRVNNPQLNELVEGLVVRTMSCVCCNYLVEYSKKLHGQERT